MHHAITQICEHGLWQNLGEDVRQVVLRWDMNRFDESLVPQHLDPFLTTVDVFESSLVSCVVREHFSCSVVHPEQGWQLESHAHFFHDVAQVQDVEGGIGSTVDFGLVSIRVMS